MPSSLRVVIVGGPRSGKTTLARRFGIAMRSTDDLKSLPWSDVSTTVAKWFDLKGSWVVEGVRTAGALRKWLEQNPEGTPADLIIFLDGARLNLTKRQQTMKKGIITIWSQITEELQRRGARVELRRGIETAELRKITKLNIEEIK